MLVGQVGKERSQKGREEGWRVTVLCRSLQSLEIPSGCVVPEDTEPLASVSIEDRKQVFNTIPTPDNN